MYSQIVTSAIGQQFPIAEVTLTYILLALLRSDLEIKIINVICVEDERRAEQHVQP